MFGGWLGRTRFLLLLGLVLLGFAAAAPASAEGPGSKLKKLTDDTFISPDRQVRVEQYSGRVGDDNAVHQFWTFDSNHRHAFHLNRGEDPDLAGYPAGFRFSRDSRWLVRMQKLGAGYHTLFL